MDLCINLNVGELLDKAIQIYSNYFSERENITYFLGNVKTPLRCVGYGATLKTLHYTLGNYYFFIN
jgi:hypothetical protein